MTARIALTALGLIFAQTLAVSAGCSGHSKQVMSCTDGTVWDQATQSCIQQTTS